MTESRKKMSRRFKPNYIYSIISTSLVLFMIGLLALLFIHGNKLANQFKENIEFTVIIKDNVSEKSILALQKQLSAEPWVKSSKYVSKEDAAKIFTRENQEDFVMILDFSKK